MIKMYGISLWNEEGEFLEHITENDLLLMKDFALKNKMFVTCDISLDCDTYFNEYQNIIFLKELKIIEEQKIIDQDVINLLRKNAENGLSEYELLMFSPEY